MECLQANGISDFVARQTEVGGREGMIPCFFTNQIIFFLFLFNFFFLRPFENDFFVYFFHSLFHFKIISLINLFNKYALSEFRLPGNVLGSGDEEVDTIDIILTVMQIPIMRGCGMWGDDC